MKNKHKLFESYRISDYPGFKTKNQFKLIESNYSNRIEYQITQDSMKNMKLFESYRISDYPGFNWKTNTNYSNRIEYQITQDSMKNKHKLFESYRISDYPGFNEKQTQTIRIV